MSNRRSPAMEERKGARKRSLLDAATRLFGQHGYHATTVPMIVAEADCSTGSFYLHFQNKEDVFNAALEQLGQAISDVMNEVKKRQPDFLAQISQGVEALFLFLAQNPEQARILIVESSGLSPRLEKTRRAILMQQQEDLRQSLAAAAENRSAEETLIAVRCIVGATFEALYSWLEEDPQVRMPAEKVAQSVAKFNTFAVKSVLQGR